MTTFICIKPSLGVCTGNVEVEIEGNDACPHCSISPSEGVLFDIWHDRKDITEQASAGETQIEGSREVKAGR